ncbi:MAG: hypothetical protein EPO32_12910 [Anaerolineae bacterium]|nr:MAG: hypothetical protein EPO32_12910 [Anaerolineae bacterium]
MIDHLAILVIYLVPPGDEWLLDLHLARLQQHTRVPYTLYAVDNRLTPELRARLSAQPNLRWVECPPMPAGRYEPDYFFTCLADRAVVDKPSHLVTLHVDSFPLADDWAQHLAGHLTETTPFLTVGRLNTACLFFSRAYYETRGPPFAQTPELNADAAFQEFRVARNIKPHTGIGFVYDAWRRGLGWAELPDTSPPDNDYFCRVYDGMIFHLGGAARLNKVSARAATLAERLPPAYWVLGKLRRLVNRLPAGRLKTKLTGPTHLLSTLLQAGRFRRARANLQRDPAGYLADRLKTVI